MASTKDSANATSPDWSKFDFSRWSLSGLPIDGGSSTVASLMQKVIAYEDVHILYGVKSRLAQFPEAVMQLKLWYIKAIDDVDITGVPEILFPFNKKIVDYAAKKAVLSTRNLDMTMAWKSEWQESVKMLAMTVGARESTNPTFVTDFTG